MSSTQTTSTTQFPKIVVENPDGKRLVFDTTVFALIIIAYLTARYLFSPLKAKIEQALFDSRPYTAEVLGLLNQLLAVTDSDRAILCLFHDGDKFFNGSSDTRATITHEVCSAGTEHIAPRIRGVPISAINLEISCMKAAGSEYHLTTQETAPPDCLRYMRQTGTAAIANYGIFKDKKQLGIISLQWIALPTDGTYAVKALLEHQDVTVLTDLLYLKIVEKTKNPVHGLIKLILEKGLGLAFRA